MKIFIQKIYDTVFMLFSLSYLSKEIYCHENLDNISEWVNKGVESNKSTCIEYLSSNCF